MGCSIHPVNTMFLLLLLVPFVTTPSPSHVDMIEWNSVFNTEDGTIKYEQVIFWEIADDGRREVVYYQVIRSPLLVTKSGEFYYLAMTSTGGRVYQIKSRSYTRTVTIEDPEMINTEVIPRDKRKGLKPSF